MEGVNQSFNEKSLSLEITAAPGLLSKRTVDYLPKRQAKVQYPKDPSGFFNYGVSYSAGNAFRFDTLGVTDQLGVRLGDFLFLTDSSYTKDSKDEKFMRLMSNVTYDRRQELQRMVLGDFFASSGNLGSNVNLGGIGFSKAYSMDPYLIRYPMANVSGMASLPSEVDVLINGVRVRTEKVSPGGFDLKNISSYGGAGAVTLVIKDAFGKEQKLNYPFYVTDILLKEGLHEYSYNAGFARKNFGEESNRYGNLAFSVFHNYGFSDSLTMGMRGERIKGRYNLGPAASFRLNQLGIVSLSLSGSADERERIGSAGIASYQYQDGRISASALIKGFTREYAVAGEEVQADKIRYETALGLGYGNTGFGSLSLSTDIVKKYVGQNRQVDTVSYSRMLWRNSTLVATFRKIREEISSTEFFIGLTYYAKPDLSLSTGYKGSDRTNTETLQAQKNNPAGEGHGYRVSLERSDAPAVSATTINPFYQYNSRYGVYTGEYRGAYDDAGRRNETYTLTASGGIAYVGKTIGLSRPITDSFGLVKVGDLQGVRVYLNNQEIGRTDAGGKVFLPTLGSYEENKVSISDKDIPMEYSLPEIAKYVSPPLRSGSLIRFDAKRFQAVTGKLNIRTEEGVRPVEYSEVRMQAQGKEAAFPTGRGGEFYLENMEPGEYKGSFVFQGKTCTIGLVIPKTEEMIIDLGSLVCEDLR
jgi:outer membrane usher protein FimD/PapC